MSLELILDVLLSAFVLAIYHADCQQQPAMAYACGGSEPPLFGNHQEFYTRQVSPENYESSDASHLITQDDVWVTDPTDEAPGTEVDHTALGIEMFDSFVSGDLSLEELFHGADAIIPMEPAVADELAAIGRKVNQKIHSSGQRVKSATVVQLRALLKSKGWESTHLPKATLNARGLELLERYDDRIEVRAVATFIVSDDRKSVLVLLK